MYMYDVVAKKFAFAISSRDEFLFINFSQCARIQAENIEKIKK